MNKTLEKKELTQILKDMELGSEMTIMAIDGSEDDIMPDLAMGVIKDHYFDSNTSTFLVGVYGSDCDFKAFFGGDYDDEDTCINAVVEWLESAGNAICSDFGGLYVKATDEEEQAFYEENKYNGEIARTIDTIDYGEVDMVSRYDVDFGVTFYDCYQKDGGGYLGEFRPTKGLSLDDFSDEEIDDELCYNLDL